MSTTKLTLRVETDLVEEAKTFAAREGTSLSSMFGRFLRSVIQEKRKEGHPGPVTRKATGLVKLPAGHTDRELLDETLRGRYAR